jgi:hypothetical protein
MMPFKIRDKNREHAIDCLICHSVSYDMNERYVVDDGVGLRWNQDRSMKAALTVTRPQSRMCLRCHQHNMGGDTYDLRTTSMPGPASTVWTVTPPGATRSRGVGQGSISSPTIFPTSTSPASSATPTLRTTRTRAHRRS